MVERETVHVKNTGRAGKRGSGSAAGGTWDYIRWRADAALFYAGRRVQWIAAGTLAWASGNDLYAARGNDSVHQWDVVWTAAGRYSRCQSERHSLHACPWGRALLSAADSAGAFKARQWGLAGTAFRGICSVFGGDRIRELPDVTEAGRNEVPAGAGGGRYASAISCSGL